MADHKHIMLHELLQQDQEPFHLTTYISDKRSQLNHSSPAAPLHLTRRSFAVPETCTHHSSPRNSCFFSFGNSPDVATPPFLELLSPAISPGGALLHVPSRTAAVLVEAAMRIQKQRQSKPKSQIMNVGLNMLGSLLKILKHRSKNRGVIDCDLQEKENSEVITTSCSRTRSCVDDLGASNSPEMFHEIGDFELQEARFCSCLLHYSPSSPLPASSPIRRRVKQEKLGGNAKVGEGEQCSPVSVLDTFFEDESVVGVEDDHDADRSCAYANIERAAQQLMARLRKFEKLASLDPVGLEQKLLEEGGVGFEGKEVGLEASGVKKRQLIRVVDKMVKSELGEWREEGVDETAAEIELGILGLLMEELSDELICMDPQLM